MVAQPFDPIARRLSGDGIRLAENVSSEGSRYASFSASKTGVLVYAPLDRPPTQLTWLDREGKTLGTVGELSRYRSPALSRDDCEVAVEVVDASLRSDLRVLNAGGKRTQLTLRPWRFPLAGMGARRSVDSIFGHATRRSQQLRRRLVSGSGRRGKTRLRTRRGRAHGLVAGGTPYRVYRWNGWFVRHLDASAVW